MRIRFTIDLRFGDDPRPEPELPAGVDSLDSTVIHAGPSEEPELARRPVGFGIWT